MDDGIGMQVKTLPPPPSSSSSSSLFQYFTATTYLVHFFLSFVCILCTHAWLNEWIGIFSSVHQDGRESHQEKRHFVGDGGGRGPCHVTVLYIVQKTDDKRRRKKVAISWQWWHATYKIVLQHNCFSKSISHRYSVHSLKSRERESVKSTTFSSFDFFHGNMDVTQCTYY